MKAIILAAGESKRLRPLTNDTPKFLLKLRDRAIIDYQLDNLKKCGVTELIFVLGFKADLVRSHLSRQHSDLTITYIVNHDYAKTYPAYGLWLAKAFLGEPILYLNADVLSHPEIIRRVISAPEPSVTAVQRTDWEEEEVNIILKDKTSEIAEMGKHISKHLSYGEFIGITKIDPTFGKQLTRVLDDFVKRDELQKFAADAINLTIQRGETMHALDVSDLPAIEIDTADDFKRATAKLDLINNGNT